MAKKSGTNAVKKIDEQIKKLESNSKDLDVDTITVKKTSSTKKTTTSSTRKKSNTTRDKVVVTPVKKKKTTTTKKKTTASKNVRGGVVTPKKDSRSNTTKTIENEKIKNNLRTKTKKEKVEVVASRERRKKELVEEVNKILEIDDNITPTEVELPKFIQDDKPVESKKEEFKDFFENDIEPPKVFGDTLDDVDVIKFKKKEPKKTKLKEKTNKEYEDLKLDKPIDLEQIDKIEEYDIVEDFKKDVSKKADKKQDFTRKRKGKGYVVTTKKKQYKELENDLRSLYDKTNSIVGDFDETTLPEKEVVYKEKTKKKSFFARFKKKKNERVVHSERGEKPSFLDKISQKVLNFFLTVLFIIFFIMVICFIAFVIYVSTF